jgi:integrase
MPTTPEQTTVGKYLHEWLEDSVKPRNRPSTYQSYEGHVRVHLIPAFGRVRLSRLTPQHVEAMMAKKLRDGLSPSTVVRIRATLRRALSRAVRLGLVQRNVAALADPPSAKATPVEAMTSEQATELLEAVEGHRLEALFVLALATGLRQGELLGLSWSDVDLEAKSLTVRHALQRVDGELTLVEPKTERSRRTLSLPPSSIKTLKTHRASQRREQLASGEAWHDSGLVFTTDAGLPLDGVNVTRAFQRLLKNAGLPKMRFHDLRHACASFLLANGASMRVVMEQLGHSQIGLTMNTYGHVMPEALLDAAEKMEAVLAQKRDA